MTPIIKEFIFITRPVTFVRILQNERSLHRGDKRHHSLKRILFLRASILRKRLNESVGCKNLGETP